MTTFWLQFGLGMAAFAVVTAIAVLAISRFVNGDGTPSDEQRMLLTSGAPGETIESWHICNALVKDAQSSFFIDVLEAGHRNRMITGSAHVPGAGAGAITIDVAKKLSGGVWVGGAIYETSHRLVFLPNRLNTALVQNIGAISIPLSEIKGVHLKSSLLVKDAVIETLSAPLNLRLRAAPAFVDHMRARLTAKALEQA